MYDDLYRLTAADITNDYQSTTLNLTFSYDPIGNIITKSDVGSYLYQNTNPYQTNSVNNRTYTYDANGNLTNDQQRTMFFDFNDRMASVTKGATTTLYYYDAGQDRSVKFEQTTHNYKIYPSKYYEERRDGNKAKYVFLGDLRLATIETTSTTPVIYLNFSDHLNSSAITTDANGNITNLMDYLPFGSDRVNVQLGNFVQNYKFTDKELDAESGLQNFGARFYNNQIGKFIQIDPVSLVLHDDEQLRDKTKQTLDEILANPQSLNNYSYTVNNPIKFVDSNGEWFDTVIDVGFILYDVGRITHQFLSQGKVEKGEWSALGLDAGSALLPGVVGLGTIARAAKGAEKAVEAVKAVEKVEDTAKAITKTKDFNAVAQQGKMLKGIENSKVINTIKSVFKKSDTIPGGTMGALRNETMTGNKTKDIFHVKKAENVINNIRNVFKTENLNKIEINRLQGISNSIKSLLKNIINL